ncbi:transposase [Rhodococcus enclensis]|nr:transposase [Rhodococcus qingshengii]
MPRPYPPEFRFQTVALVRAGKPITTAAIELGISAAALHKWVRQDQVDRGERPVSRQQNRRSRRRRTSASGNSKPRSKSSAPPRHCSGRTARPQKDSPGDRLPRRRRAPAESLLPTSRRQQPRLLHVQDPADVTDADAPSVAHWFDPRSPHSFAPDLRVSTCACGAYARYGHHGQ